MLETETADYGDWDRDPDVVAAIPVAPGHFVWFALDKVYMHEMGLVLEFGRKVR